MLKINHFPIKRQTIFSAATFLAQLNSTLSKFFSCEHQITQICGISNVQNWKTFSSSNISITGNTLLSIPNQITKTIRRKNQKLTTKRKRNLNCKFWLLKPSSMTGKVVSKEEVDTHYCCCSGQFEKIAGIHHPSNNNLTAGEHSYAARADLNYSK